ncbi:squalene synthetase-like protein [Podospora bellae-mahoneyi]|uniref:Protein SQS1 n=1 Tax=Podospora bellae-mahoneyi TaxID=2093777 RepID=A0ABR0FFU2_9PEZI|nr:squalene synthetase-like protein [Podospora bellae-mahoneyi]
MPPKRGKRPYAGPKAAHLRSTPGVQGHVSSFSSTTFFQSVTHSNDFSLKDEVRNTQSHHLDSAWISGTVKLRQKPVSFVSAGYSEPLKLLEDIEQDKVSPGEATESKADDMDITTVDVNLNVSAEAVIEKTTLVELDSAAKGKMVLSNSTSQDNPSSETPQEQAQDLFFFDVSGDKAIRDKHRAVHPPPLVPIRKPSLAESDSSEEVILFRGRAGNAKTVPQSNFVVRNGVATNTTTAITPTGHKTKPTAAEETSLRDDPEVIPVAREKRAGRQRSRSKASKIPKTDEDDEEDAILADYIANMSANPEDDFISDQLLSFNNRRDLGGDNFALNLGSGDENDMPVVEDLSGDEQQAESSGSGLSDADEDDGDENDEPDEDDDMDADMDDEELARLLAKQEELGLGSDELVLIPESFGVSKRGAKKGGQKRATSSSFAKFANASSVADAFDDLDLADWTVPVPRKRRSKQPPNFNISDSEIEAKLKLDWSRDRERKKERKLARESLRGQGLLDKNASPDDLRVKYPVGLRLEDFKTELVAFLISSDERLEFPPLDKHGRMVLHQLALKFNVKSQSTGKGTTRRPVLYRSKRTITFKPHQITEATRQVDGAARRVGRKYFPRADVAGPRGDTPRDGFRGSGHVSVKALVLREGEVVGASAPELGQENKGRAMLEKMGWSKGMALGALENKGILEPVAQVVKKSKAGLGRT